MIEIKALPGVYKITNTINGKCYVGSAIDVKQRLGRHFSHLKHNNHPNKLLQRSCSKYGIQAFKKEVLMYCDVKDILKHEQYYLELFEPVFNICRIAGNSLGRKHTPESLDKMCKVQKVVAANRTIWNKGKPFSEESKRKMSESQKGVPSWNKGIPRTQAVKDAVSKHQLENSIFAKPVIQYTLNGEFVAEFKSVRQAGLTLGKGHTGIRMCCRGEYKHSCGFVWRFKTEKGLDKVDLTYKL